MGGGGSKGGESGGASSSQTRSIVFSSLEQARQASQQFFKCIKMIKREGYDDAERKDFGRKMQNTIVKTLQQLNTQGTASGPEVDAVMAVDLENVEAETMSADIINHAKAMWAMGPIKAAFANLKDDFDDSTKVLVQQV